MRALKWEDQSLQRRCYPIPIPDPGVSIGHPLIAGAPCRVTRCVGGHCGRSSGTGQWHRLNLQCPPIPTPGQKLVSGQEVMQCVAEVRAASQQGVVLDAANKGRDETKNGGINTGGRRKRGGGVLFFDIFYRLCDGFKRYITVLLELITLKEQKEGSFCNMAHIHIHIYV